MKITGILIMIMTQITKMMMLMNKDIMMMADHDNIDDYRDDNDVASH